MAPRKAYAPPRPSSPLHPSSLAWVDPTYWQCVFDRGLSDTDDSDSDAGREMAGPEDSKGKAKDETIVLSEADQNRVASHILDRSLFNIIHDIVAEVHKNEKIARTRSAVIEVQQKAIEKAKAATGDIANDSATAAEESRSVVETEGAVIRDGKVYIKGNPMKTTKTILCGNCKLPRLRYPRVGYGARDPPDARQQYCQNEPPVIIDKHDVHGQRKKGTKMKGPGKAKKKKTEAASPASSIPSNPSTPLLGSFPAEAFDFKVLEYPAVKCPHNVKGVQDHWKTANLMASHLNGNCWLKRDRQAGRDAAAKLSGTPRESRATTPKPVTGEKRARAGDENEGNGKKKQKRETPKKNAKKTVPGPSKLKVEESQESLSVTGDQPVRNELSDSIKVDGKPGGPNPMPSKNTETVAGADKPTRSNGVKSGNSKKKPVKPSKKVPGATAGESK